METKNAIILLLALLPIPGNAAQRERVEVVMPAVGVSLGENTIVEVFQEGFTVGEKVIRFAMVKVAN